MGNFRDVDSGYQRVGALFENAKGKVVEIGFFDGAKHPRANMTMAELARIHEFGSPKRNIPERPFMRTTMNDSGDKFRKKAGSLYKAVIDGELDENSALLRLGLMIESAIQRLVRTKGKLTPNKKSKLEDKERKRGVKPGSSKGGSTPLIDEGDLMNNLTHQLNDAR